MSDDVKAANEALVESMLRQLRDCVSVGDEMTLDHACLIDDAADWIAGEPARIAAACEEVREACAQRVPSIGQPHDCFEAVRATPLTATPLADALRLANETVVKLAQASTEAQASAAEGVRYWTDLAQAEARDAAALRARVAELEAAANTAGADASAAALRAMARATNAEEIGRAHV